MTVVALDADTLLLAYSQGAFPMTDRDGAIRWYTADPRGILPLETFHVPRSLQQVVRQRRFDVRFNTCFDEVMRRCMETRVEGSWISDDLIRVYRRLHEHGYAHSVESWRDGQLVGGLYGVSLGAAFFGESMFHLERDASKVALVHLVARLRERGYELLDTQASTPHLQRFGCVEIRAEDYLRRLRRALARECRFAGAEDGVTGALNRAHRAPVQRNDPMTQ